MYCPKCGTLNNDGTNFCNNCGMSFSVNRNAYNDKRAEANYFIEVLPNLIRPLKAIVDYDLQIKNLNRDIALLKKEHSIFICIIIEILALIVSAYTAMAVGAHTTITIWDVWHVYFWKYLGLYNLVAMPVIIGFIIKKVNDKKKIKKYTDQIIESEKSIDNIIDSIKEDITILPPNYRYFFAANNIYSSFINFKADTLKEAVLICDRIKKDNYLERQYNLLSQIDSKVNRIMTDVNAIRWYTGITAFNTTFR